MRLVYYIILYIVNIVLYFLSYSYFNMGLWVLLTILPAVSVSLLLMQKKHIGIRSSCSDDTVEKGQDAEFNLLINNPFYAVSMKAEISLAVENGFYKSSGDLRINTTVPMKDVKIVPVVFSTTMCGNVSFVMDKLVLWDLLGIFKVKLPVNVNIGFTVIPRKTEISVIEEKMPVFDFGETENEQDDIKGNDFSEVTDIREYIPGDRIKDIHWKLSAKSKNLMVKERSQRADEQLVLVVDLSGKEEVLEQELELLRGVFELYVGKVIVKLCITSEEGKSIDIISIKSKADINTAFLALFSAGCNVGLEQSVLDRLFPAEIKSYLFITYDGEKAVILSRSR